MNVLVTLEQHEYPLHYLINVSQNYVSTYVDAISYAFQWLWHVYPLNTEYHEKLIVYFLNSQIHDHPLHILTKNYFYIPTILFQNLDKKVQCDLYPLYLEYARFDCLNQFDSIPMQHIH